MSLVLHVRLLLCPPSLYIFLLFPLLFIKVLLLLKPGLARLSTLLEMRTAVSLETPRRRRNAFTWVAGGPLIHASNHRSVTRSEGICTIKAGKCDPSKMCLRLRLRLCVCVCREGAHTEIQTGQDIPTIAAVGVAKSKLYYTRTSSLCLHSCSNAHWRRPCAAQGYGCLRKEETDRPRSGQALRRAPRLHSDLHCRAGL